MKDPKKDKVLRPNLKNKDFVAWRRSEPCKKEDNILSTEWHEKLKKLDPFNPVYDNKPLNMVYLLSGEYGRIWQKERDEWYKSVFIPRKNEQDMENRKKNVRMQAKAAKKAAEANAIEWKKRRAKENEAKAKAEAEKLEKLKERVRKLAAPKFTAKPQKKKKEIGKKAGGPSIQPEEEKNETCPSGWKAVELTFQCECSDHKKDKPDEEEKNTERTPEVARTDMSNEGCKMCQEYIEQMHDIHKEKCKQNEAKAESQGGNENEAEAR